MCVGLAPDTVLRMLFGTFLKGINVTVELYFQTSYIRTAVLIIFEYINMMWVVVVVVVLVVDGDTYKSDAIL